MITLLNSVLSFLPFNNWKTIIGFLLYVGPKLLPHVPWDSVQTLLNYVSDAGLVYGGTGLFHQAVKNIDGDTANV